MKRRDRDAGSKALIIADVPSPHQNVFFDALYDVGVPIEVQFCRRTMPGRAWSGEGPRRAKHGFLPEVSVGGLPTNPTVVPWLLTTRGVPFIIGYYLPGLLASGLACIGERRPWVFWTDTLEPAKPGTSTLKALVRGSIRRTFLQRSTYCLSTGAAGHQALAENGVEEARIRTLPFVVDHAWIQEAVQASRSSPGLRASLGIPKDAHVLLFVGSLIRRKGCDLILEAMKRSSSSAWCLIVGEGPDLESLRAQAKSLGVSQTVIFHPYVDYAQLPKFWAAADAMILPSRFDAWPVVVVEALVAGLPVIGSSACGSVRDCVEDGLTGWIFKSEDVAQLADRISKFEGTAKARLLRMGEQAQLSMERLSPRAVAREFGAILEEATSRGS